MACRTSKRGWWPSAVSQIVNRIEPQPMVRKGARAGGSDYLLAGLMRCPTCGTRLTGIRDRGYRDSGPRVRYACRMGSVTPHPRTTVSEHLILDAIKAEVAHLRPSFPKVRTGKDDAQGLRALEAERARVLDMYQSGDIDRAEKVRRLDSITERQMAMASETRLRDIPKVDWSWPTKELNGVLRAVFEGIDLDPVTFQPLPDGYHWSVLAWRA